MTVLVNGVEHSVEAGATVRDVLAALRIEAARGVAVARNGDVVLRSDWDVQRVEDGDRIEVLQAVQGG